ncbi:MAG: serine hydrolase [Lachnospiraceae bacterium]|nr:serine hydrolase [Lachnospiraceae bacterium]
MKKFTTFLTAVCMVLISATLTGCSETPANYTIVRFENGAVTYENSGKGTDEKTVYELGSNGKTVAAYTALAMVDDGILDLDEKIYPYLDKELITKDERMKDITLRELLCHTAGFSPSYELGTDKKIYTDPGEKFRYSGVGYIYLQSVIENSGKMTLDQAASKYVFEPLGMKNSTFESAKTVTPHMNLSSSVLYSLLIFVLSFILLAVISLIVGKITKFRFYKYDIAFLISFLVAGAINSVFLLFFFVSKVFVLFLICFAITGIILFLTKKRPVLYYSVTPAVLLAVMILGFVIPVTIPVTNDLLPVKANCAYTFRSTGEDMALFCRELMEKSENRNGSLGEMFEPAVEIDDKNAWGLGIALEYTSAADSMYWHSGINPGFQSLYVLYPEKDRFIAVMTNSDRGLDFSKEKARIFLGTDGVWDIKR